MHCFNTASTSTSSGGTLRSAESACPTSAAWAVTVANDDDNGRKLQAATAEYLPATSSRALLEVGSTRVHCRRCKLC